jgi:hypothetical protein
VLINFDGGMGFTANREAERGEALNKTDQNIKGEVSASSTDRPAQVVERLFAQPPAEGQALRRQWMENLQLPVATIDDIVNAGGKLPKTSS